MNRHIHSYALLYTHIHSYTLYTLYALYTLYTLYTHTQKLADANSNIGLLEAEKSEMYTHNECSLEKIMQLERLLLYTDKTDQIDHLEANERLESEVKRLKRELDIVDQYFRSSNIMYEAHTSTGTNHLLQEGTKDFFIIIQNHNITMSHLEYGS